MNATQRARALKKVSGTMAPAKGAFEPSDEMRNAALEIARRCHAGKSTRDRHVEKACGLPRGTILEWRLETHGEYSRWIGTELDALRSGEREGLLKHELLGVSERVAKGRSTEGERKGAPDRWRLLAALDPERFGSARQRERSGGTTNVRIDTVNILNQLGPAELKRIERAAAKA